MSASSDNLRPLAERAADLVADGMVIGLGTGRAATAFIHALGERVRRGLRVVGVPTSRESERLATELSIPLTTLDDVAALDIDLDGADEVDPQGNLIKGYGGALLREKIIAAAARQLVILVGEEKLVPTLGARGTLPVEVTPFALKFCQRRLETIGFPSQPRMHDGRLLITDNGNHILDCQVSPFDDPAATERAICDIPGVVETGLFLNFGPQVLIQTAGGVEKRSFAKEPA
jgi:ribose 5-phosphate isomerase A